MRIQQVGYAKSPCGTHEVNSAVMLLGPGPSKHVEWCVYGFRASALTWHHNILGPRMQLSQRQPHFREPGSLTCA